MSDLPSQGCLSGRVALVTGAAHGVGAGIACGLAAAGASVAVADIAAESAQAVAEQLKRTGSVVRAYTLDVSGAADVERVFAQAEQDLGPIDIAVNNAGISRVGDHTHNVSDENWHTSINVMQHGVFYGMRAAGRTMLRRRQGVIINVSSIRAHSVKLGTIEYSAAKAAVVAMTQVAAAEWGPFGVRVNAIAPGPITTEMTTRDAQRGAMDPQRYLETIPLRRYGRVDEVADLAVFLASDRATYISGTVITIDGALTATGADAQFTAPWPDDGPEFH
jgi:NAD(P)-dependent dehydrogenase (short-subunit alcohol dehydrogenase family)